MTTPLLASHGTFGLNLDIFETNIINLAIVIAGLTWFLRGFLGGILARRRERILAELKDAEDRLASATASLTEAQASLADARARAEKIRIDGKARAEAIRLESEKRTVEEMARLKQDSQSDLASEVSRVSKQLQREAAEMAIEKALASLPSRLDATTQAQLIDQSIQTLGKA
ncbi:F0F1 ATP synthase subunit B [Synechococcus sp. CCY 9618]|uniref:F0F1 ATP synthase subunit B n=1 Tax=Synechococcus sp. CCY 9618 TaxID=2815602 RepID=UPI001C23A2B3